MATRQAPMMVMMHSFPAQVNIRMCIPAPIHEWIFFIFIHGV